jgi:hypothetical protein
VAERDVAGVAPDHQPAARAIAGNELNVGPRPPLIEVGKIERALSARAAVNAPGERVDAARGHLEAGAFGQASLALAVTTGVQRDRPVGDRP